MALKDLINSAAGLAGLKISRTVSSLGNKLGVYGIAKQDYEISGGNITFHKLKVTIPYNKALPVLEGYENAVNLVTQGGASFFTDAENNVNVRVAQAQFVINDQEELYILSEVFLEGSYNLLAATNKKIALIDIGMNVGITSLFYASKPEVEKTFSFEPFLPTFNMALNNIKLNPSFSHKLNPNNFGLAKENGSMTISYSTKQKGRMGFGGAPSSITDKYVTQQEIFLKPVADEFAKIKPQVQDNFVVCKMDCEGAEYEIIDALHSAGLLSLPDMYFIEWHVKSPDDIIAKLVQCNFNVIGTTFKGKPFGMIYAIKKGA